MQTEAPPRLRRQLGLPLLVLYGTGITIGAGIYVLIGAVAGHAGPYAPWSFGLAALVMGLTVASYSDLATRFPVSAGEAAYVRAAFNRQWLTRAIGLLTAAIGIVSSSAVAVGAAGYIRQFVSAPDGVIILVVLLAIGAVASWGILESVVMASLFTLIEVGGLLIIIVAAAASDMTIPLPPFPFAETAALPGIGFASLLAFFAFIGFEDLVNVAEEAKDPERDLPRAMALTLLISGFLYFTIATIAVGVVPPKELAASQAPLALVFQKVAHVSPATISLIAIVATLNTILAQLTMVSRVLYGMAQQGDLPAALGRVNAQTRTPLIATWMTVAIALGLSLTVPIVPLAESTAIATLLVFASVNLSLIALNRQGAATPTRHLRIPVWVPWLGLLSSLAMIALALAPTR